MKHMYKAPFKWRVCGWREPQERVNVSCSRTEAEVRLTGRRTGRLTAMQLVVLISEDEGPESVMMMMMMMAKMILSLKWKFRR